MKYLDIKGKNVINKKGHLIGFVESLLIDRRNKTIHSLMISNTMFLKSYYLIPLKNVKSFNDPIEYYGDIYKIKKSILVRNKEIVLQKHMDDEIVDVRGRKIGKLIDIIFDAKNGHIKGMISTDGFFEDLFDGRKIIIVNNNTKFQRNRVIVDELGIEMKNDVYFKKFLKD